MNAITARRLTLADIDTGRQLFILMAHILEEECEPLSDGYLQRLLGREDFWVIAGFVDGDLVGGLTAHTLPMTRTQSAEIFVYDVAVRVDQQRKGVGRQLIATLREAADAQRIGDIVVPVENEDTHALEFYRAVGGRSEPVTLFTFPSR